MWNIVMTKHIRYADVIALLERLGFEWERRDGIGLPPGRRALVFRHPEDAKALILLPDERPDKRMPQLTVSGLEVSLDNSGHFTREQFETWRNELTAPRNGAVGQPKVKRKKPSTEAK